MSNGGQKGLSILNQKCSKSMIKQTKFEEIMQKVSWQVFIL